MAAPFESLLVVRFMLAPEGILPVGRCLRSNPSAPPGLSAAHRSLSLTHSRRRCAMAAWKAETYCRELWMMRIHQHSALAPHLKLSWVRMIDLRAAAPTRAGVDCSRLFSVGLTRRFQATHALQPHDGCICRAAPPKLDSYTLPASVLTTRAK